MTPREHCILEIEVNAGVGEGVEAREDVGSWVGQQVATPLSSHSHGGVSHGMSNGVGHGVSQTNGGAGVGHCMSHRVGSYSQGSTSNGNGRSQVVGQMGNGGGRSEATQTSKLKI